ncbi:MAG: UpxY family transcription antiterminator, partial [Acidobacteriaceae bacterium]|nr:UpxY family transcription antiterminator [Acidobacteriaceae bacterium]
MNEVEIANQAPNPMLQDNSESSEQLPTSAHVHWYAAYVCSRHEKQVVSQLQERRVACFLPVYRSLRRWKDRRKELELVLFPGYVFVHLDLKDRLRVLQLPSVVRFVSFNGHPAPLPDSEIEILSKGLASGIRAEPHPYLKVGHRVRVRSGPLAGAQGILQRKKEKFRVVLSIDLIMRSVAVEVDEAD